MSELDRRKQALNGTEMLPEAGTNGGMMQGVGKQMDMAGAGGATAPMENGSSRAITLGTGAKKEFTSRVTRDRLAEANRILESYKVGKAAHDQRVMENERGFLCRHFEDFCAGKINADFLKRRIRSLTFFSSPVILIREFHKA